MGEKKIMVYGRTCIHLGILKEVQGVLFLELGKGRRAKFGHRKKKGRHESHKKEGVLTPQVSRKG